MPFCMNCGQQLPDGARFCSACGTPAGETSNNGQRQQEWAGRAMMCPMCGNALNSFKANCPACGYELRGSRSSYAIQEFALKLEQIENSRDISGNAFSGLKNKINKFGSVDSVDEQKISLIRNFTIPNTKEDVYEFMILAASNIDLKLYGMAYHSSQFQGMLVASQRAVSDAWLAKFEQAYQKAQLLFTDGQELLNINELYAQKMKEMRKKKRELPLFVVGIVGSMVIIFLIIWIPLFLSGAFEFNSANDYEIESENTHFEERVNVGFIDGYEKAEFSKYNSPASENGLEDSRIYFYCTLDRIEILEANETISILGYVTDDTENEWLIQLHFVPAVSKTAFDSYVGEELVLRGVYSGYSSVKAMPVVVLDEMIVLSTGENVMGMQKLLDE